MMLKHRLPGLRLATRLEQGSIVRLETELFQCIQKSVCPSVCPSVVISTEILFVFMLYVSANNFSVGNSSIPSLMLYQLSSCATQVPKYNFLIKFCN